MILFLFQVTKQEVHKVWAEMKKKIEGNNSENLKQQTDKVISLTKKLIEVHKKIDFLTEEQFVDVNSG